MSKVKAKENKIKALAYFHRYGWIAVIMICVVIWTEQMMLIFHVVVLPFQFGPLLDTK